MTTMTTTETVTPPHEHVLTTEGIAADLEQFIRERFDVPEDDLEFSCDVDLWEEGYVDSAGVVEVVSHLEETWKVKIPEDALFDPRFTRISGMAEVICLLAE